jgi:hypothetical protein
LGEFWGIWDFGIYWGKFGEIWGNFGEYWGNLWGIWGNLKKQGFYIHKIG